MSKKPSLAAALQPFERSATATATPAAPARSKSHRRAKSHSVAAMQAASRSGKKALIGYFDPGVSKQIKQLALNRDTSAQELLREALNDFFQKNKLPTIA